MFLTDEELRELTNKRQRNCQMSVLRSMGIMHKQRPDGTIAVLRSHVEKELGGSSLPAVTKTSPNWDAFNAS